MDFRAHYKKIVQDVYKGEGLEAAFQYCTGVGDKTELLWSTDELLKAGEIPVELAVKVAEYFYQDSDPKPDDSHNLETVEGKEVSYIATVRATVCWLLLSILGRLDTSSYPRVMSMVEKLALVETEKNAYVRRNAAIPLGNITRNLRAVQTPDLKPFRIDDQTKQRAIALSYRMLEQNSAVPRVLQYLVNVFDGMRDLDEKHAMHVLQRLFYKNDSSLQPDYVTTAAAPLAIFYAEFRVAAFRDTFNEAPFKNFLKELIKNATAQTPLLTTIIWHFWKTIKDDNKTLEKLSPYFQLFFDSNKDRNGANQLEFLATEVMQIDFERGVALYNQYLDNLRDALRNDSQSTRQRGIFVQAFNVSDVLMRLQKEKPQAVPPLLRKLASIVAFGMYVSHLDIYIADFQKLPAEAPYREEIKRDLNNLITTFKGVFNNDLIKTVD